MCEICKWAQERDLICLKEPVQIQLPMAIATHAYGLQSPIFKVLLVLMFFAEGEKV